MDVQDLAVQVDLGLADPPGEEGELGGEHHADRHRRAVPPAVALSTLDRVAERVAVTTRLREEIVDGASAHDAAAMAVAHAGPTVASAGAILAGTFASLMVTGVKLLSEMGFAVAFGILLVAIVMASTLVPSIATLLGSRIWWPGHQVDRPQEAAGGVPEHADVSAGTHGSEPADARGVPAQDPAAG